VGAKLNAPVKERVRTLACRRNAVFAKPAAIGGLCHSHVSILVGVDAAHDIGGVILAKVCQC
jgi:hypothetical protein